LKNINFYDTLLFTQRLSCKKWSE